MRDLEKIRGDFPILSQSVNGRPLVYLDNAATSQKPTRVIERLSRYYREENANIHRGVHLLSERATEGYEEARLKVQRFLHARRGHEIVFVRGTTEAINLVAQSFGRNLKAGDEVVITLLEHHSNIVPWQMICGERGAGLKAIPISDAGELQLDAYERLLSEKTKLVAVTHLSNALGTVNPVKRIIEMAHRRNIPVLVDGAQAVSHFPVDVQALDCDFYVFSGHKMYGPTGIGVLYGKEDLLESMPPWQGGGDMIRVVTLKKTVYNELPFKFEAGTPPIAGAIGLAAAIDYINDVGWETITPHEQRLLNDATAALSDVEGLRIVGTAREKAAVVSFVLEGVHPHDIGTILDGDGIAIRTGHHCAMPLMDRLGLPATARASFAFYNTKEEIDLLAAGLGKVRKVFEGTNHV